MADFKDHKTALLENIMQKILNDKAISTAAYNLWFEKCRLRDIDSKNVYLTVENETKRDSIVAHYIEILTSYFTQELGYEPCIIVEVSVDESQIKKEITAEKYDSRKSEANYVTDKSYFKKNNVYTFDNYVVGSSNSFAYNAAKRIAKKPSDEFNPLYIYGPSGIGKTHLMYAIANEILENYPEKTILYVKGEEFTSSLIGSIKEGTMDFFRNKYRNADVLLVDDIQVIAGKKATQEEFFFTFDALYEKHKQIILTSDCAPADISILVDRLKGRFSMGLVTDIQLPDFELRLAILRKKSESVGLNLSDEILEYLADKLHSNIRVIEGVIKKLSAMSFINGTKITMDTVKESAAEFIKDDLTEDQLVTKIIEETAKKYDVTVKDIIGKKRDKNIKNARNVSMYIIKQETDFTLADIGMMYDRTHPTVYSNIEAVKKSLESDPYLSRMIEDIIKSLKQ